MKQQHCPYVGLERDAETHLTYPSVRNMCHRARPKHSVNLAHQEAYCLTVLHHQCRMFSQPVESPLPYELRAFPPRPRPTTRTVLILLGGLFLALALAVAFGAWGLLAMPATPTLPTLSTGTHTPTGDTPAFAVPSTATPTLSASHTITPTALPSITPTTPIAAPALPSATSKACTPPAGWVVYIVQPGDTLYQLAQTFGISMALLQQGNCMATTTLIAGSRLYVPNVATRTSTAASTTAYTLTPTHTDVLPSLTPTVFPTDIPTFTPLPTLTAYPSTATPTATTIPYPH